MKNEKGKSQVQTLFNEPNALTETTEMWKDTAKMFKHWSCSWSHTHRDTQSRQSKRAAKFLQRLGLTSILLMLLPCRAVPCCACLCCCRASYMLLLCACWVGPDQQQAGGQEGRRAGRQVLPVLRKIALSQSSIYSCCRFRNMPHTQTHTHSHKLNVREKCFFFLSVFRISKNIKIEFWNRFGICCLVFSESKS